MMILAPPGIFFVTIVNDKGKLTIAAFNNMVSLYYLSSLCLSLKMLVFSFKVEFSLNVKVFLPVEKNALSCSHATKNVNLGKGLFTPKRVLFDCT